MNFVQLITVVSKSLFKKLSKYIGLISDWVNIISMWLCVIFGFGILLAMDIAVFSRYISQASLLWPEEVSRFLMIWLTFVGGSVAMKEKGLIFFQFILNAIPEGKTKISINICTKLAIITFIIWFLKYGEICIRIYQRFRFLGTGMPYSWAAFGLIVGGVLMLIHMTHFILEDISRFNINRNITNKEECK